MKTPLSLIFVLLFTTTLLACTPRADRTISSSSSPSPVLSSSNSSSSASTAPAQALDVQLFTIDELFAQEGGGCGMTLWKQEDGLRPPGYLFFNRLAQKAGDEFTTMKINGEFVRFRRTAATGEERYGQYTSQTFVSQDGTIQLQVDVKYGEPGEIESFAVGGTMRVQQGEQTIEAPVQGSTGC